MIKWSKQDVKFRSVNTSKSAQRSVQADSLLQTASLGAAKKIIEDQYRNGSRNPKKWLDQRGTRTRNLQIRSLTRYPLRQPVWSASCDVCAAFAHTVICVNKLKKAS